MNRLAETIIAIAAKVILPLAEMIQQRQAPTSRPSRARLDPKLELLSIDEAVRRASAELEVRRRRNDDGSK